MALAANALTNVATMESVLGLASGSADTALQRAINQASAIAESYAGRVFYRTTHTEKHAGVPGPILIVKNPPINSITSITYLSGTAESSSTYEIADADVGEIFRVSGTWVGLDWGFGDASETLYTGAGRRVWTVVYNGGWYTPKQDDDGDGTRTLPYDLEQAVIGLAVHLYHSESRDPTVRSESLMEASQTYSAGTTSQGVAHDWLASAVPATAAILKRYRLGYLG